MPLVIHATAEHVLVANLEPGDVGFPPGHRPRVSFAHQDNGGDTSGTGLLAVARQEIERDALIMNVVDDHDMPILKVHTGLRHPPGNTAARFTAVPRNLARIQQKVAFELTGKPCQRHEAPQQHAEEHALINRYERLRGGHETFERCIDFGPGHQKPRTHDWRDYQLRDRPGRAWA